MPGSPPTRTREPGTIPPPRSLSTSGRPSERRGSLLRSISLRRMGLRPSEDFADRPLEPLPPPAGFFSTGASTMVFHSPHAGQRPIHLGLSLPQLVQYHKVFAVAIIIFARPFHQPGQIQIYKFFRFFPPPSLNPPLLSSNPDPLSVMPGLDRASFPCALQHLTS